MQNTDGVHWEDMMSFISKTAIMLVTALIVFTLHVDYQLTIFGVLCVSLYKVVSIIKNGDIMRDKEYEGILSPVVDCLNHMGWFIVAGVNLVAIVRMVILILN